MNNTLCLLALNRMKGVGPRTILKLYQKWPQLDFLFKLKKKEREALSLPKYLQAGLENWEASQLEEDLAFESAHASHHILSFEDPHYPALLKEIPDPPPILYAKGNLACLNQAALALIGTRTPSPIGRETAWHFSKTLAAHFVIVSGLALGIDRAAHEGCLAAQGKTIAVLGTGLNCLYPRQNKTVAQAIFDNNGLLLSEFPLNTSPLAGHFPRRNRIISGLSQTVLIVEARLHSGSLITARLALEQNREVMAIPGSIYQAETKGCHYLISQGATLVSSPQDILDELGLKKNNDVSAPPLLKAPQAFEKELLACIGYEGSTFEQILARSGLALEVLAKELASLELLGMIRAITGGYVRCPYEK